MCFHKDYISKLTFAIVIIMLQRDDYWHDFGTTIFYSTDFVQLSLLIYCRVGMSRHWTLTPLLDSAQRAITRMKLGDTEMNDY